VSRRSLTRSTIGGRWLLICHYLLSTAGKTIFSSNNLLLLHIFLILWSIPLQKPCVGRSATSVVHQGLSFDFCSVSVRGISSPTVLLLPFGSFAHRLRFGHHEFDGWIGFSADPVAILRLAAASALRIVSTSPGLDCWATSRAFLNQLVNDIPAKYICQTSYFAWSSFSCCCSLNAGPNTQMPLAV
jgi:hypothetical protein